MKKPVRKRAPKPPRPMPPVSETDDALPRSLQERRSAEPEEDASIEDPLLDWPDEDRFETDPRKADPVDE